MDEKLMPLDQWIAEKAAGLRGRERQVYIYFQKEWGTGHYLNPLLFPQQLSRTDWQDNFDWFLTIEDFTPPVESLAPAVGTEDQPLIEATPAQTDAAEARTLIMERTVTDQVFKPALPTGKPEPPIESGVSIKDQKGEAGDLDDLDTLVLEHEQKDKTLEAVPAKKPAAAPPAAKPSPGRPQAVPSPQTHKKVEREQTSRTVVTRTETVPDAAEAGTMILEPSQAGDQGAPIVDRPSQATRPAAAAALKAQPSSKPSPKPAAKPLEDHELDLDDLETMEWDKK
ncbi:MAG: hypothetical protein AB1641_29980 [Thermodesulfobacteriota bacterium]